MKFLCDTNVVLRYVNAADADHALVARYVDDLCAGGAELCIASQILFEFWSVATRPAETNGLGLSIDKTRATIDAIRTSFGLLPDPVDLLERWLDLCTLHAVRGRQAHDARLVAFMVGHGIDRALTLNAGDFARYTEIKCVAPVAL